MTHIALNPIHDEFIAACKSATKSIRLCAPFVKHNTILNIIEMKSSCTTIDLITNLRLESLHRKASDIEAIEAVVGCGNVFNCSTLHAKLYIFDDASCYVTSANLTMSGMRKNVECSMFSSDSGIVKEAVHAFETIQKHSDTGIVCQKKCDMIKEMLTKIPAPSKTTYPELEFHSIGAKAVPSIATSLNGWMKDVFLEVNSLDTNLFTSQEITDMTKRLSVCHPENHNVRAKIRQTLQYLRDLGLIEFTSHGAYKRLWEKGQLT